MVGIAYAGWAPTSLAATSDPTVRLTAPIVGIAATPTGGGYWEAGADCGVFAFGNATYDGSLGGHHLAAPVVGIAASDRQGILGSRLQRFHLGLRRRR